MRNGLGTSLVEAVDEVEGVAGNSGHIGDLALDVSPDLAMDLLEAVEASVFVGQGRAHPRLRVAHLPCPSPAFQVLQLRQRLPQLVHGVRHLKRGGAREKVNLYAKR